MAHYGTQRKTHIPTALIVAAVVAVVVVPIVLVGPERGQGPPDAAVGRIEAVAREIRTVPQLSAEKKTALVANLGDALENLYQLAFVAPGPDPTAPPSPAPTHATRVDGLFTSKARDALREDPDVFRRVESVRVGEGLVAFGGVVTLDGSKPVQAYLEIVFDAKGVASGSSTRVRLRQEGRLLLVATADGWRVDGFALRFASRPETPRPGA